MNRAIDTIHVIFKTHLDVGFTDFSANVVQNYFTSYIPKAIALAEELRQSGSSDRFVWTTGSWLIYEYLEWADRAARERMEAAIASGDITWHALPFTTHTELMDAPLFRFGLSLSNELDLRFGKQTHAAKMTDVPGHTRGVVPLLAEAGVQFLHIGVNGASTPPDVPPVFRWRDRESSAEILVMYHKGSYGDLMTVPGLRDAIAFAHTGDNLGPQSAEALAESYDAIRRHIPGARVQASTMDAFAAQLATVRQSLPVIEGEIGDTWIHGAGTDPVKVAQYRELLRLREPWLADQPERLRNFHRKLLVVPEHTWGLDVKTHLKDFANYHAKDFQAARSGENYRKMETSWREQRQYIEDAVAALPEPQQNAAREAIEILTPSRPDTGGYEPLDDPAKPVELGTATFALDPQCGFLTRLEIEGVPVAGFANPIGKFWYETFSAADYARFHRQYNVNKRQTREWAIPDFTKPGLETAEHEIFLPALTFVGVRREEGGGRMLLLLEMPERAHTVYGAPKHASLEIETARDEPRIRFTLQWFDKPACRMPEALWFSFVPKVTKPENWKLEKLERWISPLEVIRDGNRHLHAVTLSARYDDGSQQMQIDTYDAPLIAPGAPSLINFTNRQPDLSKGLHVNLFNNLWGTTFPMWLGEDAKFRFALSLR